MHASLGFKFLLMCVCLFQIEKHMHVFSCMPQASNLTGAKTGLPCYVRWEDEPAQLDIAQRVDVCTFSNAVSCSTCRGSLGCPWLQPDLSNKEAGKV